MLSFQVIHVDDEVYFHFNSKGEGQGERGLCYLFIPV